MWRLGVALEGGKSRKPAILARVTQPPLHVTPAPPEPDAPPPAPDFTLGPDRVVLVDGPSAGLVVPAPLDACSLPVPGPLGVELFKPFERDPFTISRVTGYYRLAAGHITFSALPLERFDVRIGWIGSEDWPQGAIEEHVPTVLALEHVVPWPMVPPTQLDKAEPLECGGGDPNRACEPELTEFYGHEVRGSCLCGWETLPVPAHRRSKLARAIHRHLVEMDRRRSTEALTLPVLNTGTGPSVDCEALLTLPTPPDGKNAATGRVHGRYGRFGIPYASWASGHCPGCGWRTGQVPPQLRSQLMAAIDAHQQERFKFIAEAVPLLGGDIMADLLAFERWLRRLEADKAADAEPGAASAEEPEADHA